LRIPHADEPGAQTDSHGRPWHFSVIPINIIN
jgi:hypothetical protein